MRCIRVREILCINGGNILSGEVNIGGAKNSMVALIPAAIITKSIIRLNNVKPIDDTYTLIKILEKLNVKTFLLLIQNIMNCCKNIILKD
jgi:UDP-N-acetylglucosamine enolpyruvyl transferase